MRPFLLFPIIQPIQAKPARPLILSAVSRKKREHLVLEFHSTVSCVNMSKISFPIIKGNGGE